MNEYSQVLIDLAAISHNMAVIKSYLKLNTKLMAGVKANAYGHGASEVAAKIAPDIYGFAVNDPGEGVELRKSGIKKPILVFGVPGQETAPLYKNYNLIATISNEQHFRILPGGVSYHLNFNTGMGRLGFRPEQVKQVKSLVKKHTDLTCKGLYSHFPTADEPGSTKVEKQLSVFDKICCHFDESLLKHISNTAGIVQYDEAHFDMVRAGISLYGYTPGNVEIPELKPALSWKTHLVQVNEIKQGETVSYGATWEAPENGSCGIIPVGYSDGIPFNLSGDFRVLINDKIYPVVGRVTMNYCIIYLGDDKIQNGTEVSLLNKQLTAQRWADATGSISYEILTSISPHITRYYINA